jgi:hypothetical protein
MADKNIALSHRPSPTLQEGDVGDAVQLRKHAKPHRLGLSDRVPQAGKETTRVFRVFNPRRDTSSIFIPSFNICFAQISLSGSSTSFFLCKFTYFP